MSVLKIAIFLIHMNSTTQRYRKFFRESGTTNDHGNKFVNAGHFKPSINSLQYKNRKFFRTRGISVDHGYIFVSAGNFKPSMNSQKYEFANLLAQEEPTKFQQKISLCHFRWQQIFKTFIFLII